MERNYIKGTKFEGNEVSEYGLQNKRVDYATLDKAFDSVLCNSMMYLMRSGKYSWEMVNGTDYDEEDDSFREIYQYYVISDYGYRILSEYTDEIVYYCDELDIYVWGVTHYGTAWDYVLTSIEIVD